VEHERSGGHHGIDSTDRADDSARPLAAPEGARRGLAGGTPAQLVQNDWGVWLDLARGGSIRELTSFFKAEKRDPAALFIPWSITQYSHREALYGFPGSISADSFPYNKTLFAEQGLRPPPADTADKNWTMERFLEVTQS
jgi:ABC-type glycerol-3-phosphate transport system substrate-binding protein